MKKQQDLGWVLLIATVTLVVHFLTYDMLGFHRDEFLYLALGRRPAAGFWSNPPLIGLISYLSQLIPGDPLFTTRLFPALAGALLVVLTGLIARELGGKRYAQLLACSSLSVSLLVLRGYSMLQPVPFDILFWTLILYSFLRYVNTQQPLYLVMIGVFFGLGLLNKYMVVFLAAGLLGALSMTPYRRLWTDRYLWLAVATAILIFLPNLIWQVIHNFPVLRHMQELKETQLVNVQRANILIDQLLMLTIGTLVWLPGLIWLLFSPQAKVFRVFGWIYLLVLMIFLLLRGKSYYTAGLYPFLFAAGGVAIEGMISSRVWRWITTILIIGLSLPLVPGGIPIMKADKLASYFAGIPPQMGGEALLRWEDGKMHSLPQDYADMLGWDELGSIVVRACDTIADKDRIMIYAENYGQAGAIEHFGRSSLPEVASFSDSYILWVPDSIPREKDLFIYVNHELGSDVDSLFARIDSVGSITHPHSREYGTTVYLCRSPRADFRAFWTERVKEVRTYYGLP